jgi:hypothetical protein
MSIVHDIIEGFSKQELREFKYFAVKNGLKNERKDLRIIDELRKGNETTSTFPNAYHQTLKRLKVKLEQFAILENSRLNPSSQIHNYLDIAKYLIGKAQYKHAWTYLKKAELEAHKLEEYELVEYIYCSQISFIISSPYANIPNISVPELLQKREANMKLAKINANANAAYALLIHEVKEKFARGLHNQIDQLLDDILNKYLIQENLDDYPKIYSRIVITLCRALREKKDYKNLAIYSLSSYQSLVEKKMFNKISLDNQMELLRAIYQSSIRTKDFETSEKYQKIFKLQSEGYKQHAEKYAYYNFRANVMAADICMCTNRLHQAKEILFELLAKYENYDKSSIVFIFLRVNLLALHFKQNEFGECERLYKMILKQDEKVILLEEGMGLELILNTEIYGCLVHFEKGDFEEADYLQKKIRRKYAVIFKKEEGKRELNFLKILERLINNPSYKHSKKFKMDAEKFVSLREFVPADKEYISLNAWLLSKLHKTNYYTSFLNQMK